MPRNKLRRQAARSKGGDGGNLYAQFEGPTSVTGLKVWLKADALSLANNDPVATWTDSSGNGNDAIAAGTDRPTYKTAIQNGKAVVRFAQASSNKMSTAAFGVALSQPSVIFAACKPRASDLACTVFDGIVGTSRHVLGAETTAANDTIMHAGASLTGSVAVVGTWYLYACVFNGASSKLYRDGGAANASGDAGAHTLTGLRVGVSFADTSFMDGDIGELLVYNALVSDTNINNIGGYLATRWGLSWSAVS